MPRYNRVKGEAEAANAMVAAAKCRGNWMRRIGFLSLACISCGGKRVAEGREQNSRECVAEAGARNSVLDSTGMAQLAGEFELTVVNTVRGYQAPLQQGRLRLALNDTTNRFYNSTIRGRVRTANRLLAGTFVSPPYVRDTVTSEGQTFVIGCQYWMCTDASPSYFAIDRADPIGFSGRWSNAQTGIARHIDKNGRMLPNPEGYYCARRVGA